RLALQAAAPVLNAYPDGVWLAELAALSDPALVPQAVAAALGLLELPGAAVTGNLVDYLRTRTLLLILDNCEHLLGAVAQLVAAVLRQCSGLRVLVTSREPLGCAGETTWRVPSLLMPPASVTAEVVPEQLPAFES